MVTFEPSTKGKAEVPSIKDSFTGGRYAWLPLSPVQKERQKFPVLKTVSQEDVMHGYL